MADEKYYYCSKCSKGHWKGSGIGKEHIKYKIEEMYYCSKCNKGHYRTSGIGEKHTEYKI
ncbi:MAG: hypothetical protein WC974_06215 [Thermoplasmata archaeon]